MTTNAFLLSWDCYGLESCVPITQYEDLEKEALFDILNNKEPKANPLSQIVYRMTLRARFNPQRNYEIYAVDCDPSITEDSLVQLFENDPQAAAELIRAKGIKLYSDRTTAKRCIV